MALSIDHGDKQVGAAAASILHAGAAAGARAQIYTPRYSHTITWERAARSGRERARDRSTGVQIKCATPHQAAPLARDIISRNSHQLDKLRMKQRTQTEQAAYPPATHNIDVARCLSPVACVLRTGDALSERRPLLVACRLCPADRLHDLDPCSKGACLGDGKNGRAPSGVPHLVPALCPLEMPSLGALAHFNSLRLYINV
jgi:hypothetical protein